MTVEAAANKNRVSADGLPISNTAQQAFIAESSSTIDKSPSHNGVQDRLTDIFGQTRKRREIDRHVFGDWELVLTVEYGCCATLHFFEGERLRLHEITNGEGM
ncbi:hypothetical protein [Methylobacterium tarhaniae]|uniref:hypothetical protein n=1 Tax=Methylobacterium tarhaniae TaxID=1187852 RepID=UPI000A943C15|nr:hypothetical protein [Methylobacterium tarhaniae]